MRPRSLLRLALTGISSNPLRSWLVAGCALLVAAMVLSTVLISRGGEESLRLARERLGADVVVVPRGSITGIEGALLLGNATNTYMPRDVVQTIAAVPGVAIASPQLYLTSMANSSCCSVSLMFMFAFDPVTDFTIEPWLKQKLGHDLGQGQAVGGSNVFVPDGQDKIKLYGYDFDLVGNLEPTGTNLDQSLFMTFPTAFDMEKVSQIEGEDAPGESRGQRVVGDGEGGSTAPTATRSPRRSRRPFPRPRPCRPPRCSARTARRSRASCAP